MFAEISVKTFSHVCLFHEGIVTRPWLSVETGIYRGGNSHEENVWAGLENFFVSKYRKNRRKNVNNKTDFIGIKKWVIIARDSTMRGRKL